jgi:acetyltransferase-like isoleucine patch superfamily enzyme
MQILSTVNLAEPYLIDENVLLGYPSGRVPTLPPLTIGANARIRSGSVLYAGSTIGKSLETGHNVTIREENILGDEVKIWNNSTIDYGCKIGSRVRIHCNVYIAQFTIIEDEVFLAPGVSIANDLHPICMGCLKGPVLKKGARIGINAVLLPHISIGEYALIGAGSVVTRDVPPYSVAAGNPAKIIKKLEELKCRQGKKPRAYP